MALWPALTHGGIVPIKMPPKDAYLTLRKLYMEMKTIQNTALLKKNIRNNRSTNMGSQKGKHMATKRRKTNKYTQTGKSKLLSKPTRKRPTMAKEEEEKGMAKTTRIPEFS